MIYLDHAFWFTVKWGSMSSVWFAETSMGGSLQRVL